MFTALACAMRNPEEPHMLDLVFLAIGLGFFELAIAYAYACDRL